MNSSAARELLRPCPSRCLDTLATLLPRVAAYGNQTLLAELNAALAKLRSIPSNVDEFMALMAAMADTQEKYEGLMERREFVQVGALASGRLLAVQLQPLPAFLVTDSCLSPPFPSCVFDPPPPHPPTGHPAAPVG